LLCQLKQPAVSAADIDEVPLAVWPIARSTIVKRHARLDAPESMGMEIVSRTGLFRCEAPVVLALIKELQRLRSGRVSTGVETAGLAMGQLQARRHSHHLSQTVATGTGYSPDHERFLFYPYAANPAVRSIT
jgi:hypothetical protein